jgi:hypothetical protein
VLRRHRITRRKKTLHARARPVEGLGLRNKLNGVVRSASAPPGNRGAVHLGAGPPRAGRMHCTGTQSCNEMKRFRPSSLIISQGERGDQRQPLPPDRPHSSHQVGVRSRVTGPSPSPCPVRPSRREWF